MQAEAPILVQAIRKKDHELNRKRFFLYTMITICLLVPVMAILVRMEYDPQVIIPTGGLLLVLTGNLLAYRYRRRLDVQSRCLWVDWSQCAEVDGDGQLSDWRQYSFGPRQSIILYSGNRLQEHMYHVLHHHDRSAIRRVAAQKE